MQFDRVYSFLMPKLEQELPNHLTYHNAAHTKEVIRTVQDLAAREGIAQRQQPRSDRDDQRVGEARPFQIDR